MTQAVRYDVTKDGRWLCLEELAPPFVKLLELGVPQDDEVYAVRIELHGRELTVRTPEPVSKLLICVKEEEARDQFPRFWDGFMRLPLVQLTLALLSTLPEEVDMGSVVDRPHKDEFRIMWDNLDDPRPSGVQSDYISTMSYETAAEAVMEPHKLPTWWYQEQQS